VYIYIINYIDMRTTRLNERDLARIVRRVLREENEMFDEKMGDGPFDKCFKSVGIPIPPACQAADGEDMCRAAISKMMTPENLMKMGGKLGELLTCIGKGGSTPPPTGGSDRQGMKFPGFKGGMF